MTKIMTLNEAHAMCTDGDRVLRVCGSVRGKWYEDRILTYLNIWGEYMCRVVEETDEMISVVILARGGKV